MFTGLLGIITLTGIGLLSLTIIASILIGIRWLTKEHKLTTEAVVNEKHTSIIYDSRDSGADESTTEYYITFRGASGEYIDLRVGKRDFNRYNEGDRGELTYKGSEFIKFRRMEKGSGNGTIVVQ